MTEIATLAEGERQSEAAGRRKLVWRRFLRNTPAIVGAVVLLLMVVLAFALPPLLPYDYQQLDYTSLLQPPSPRHPFGTNKIGKDVLAQTLRGLQKSLIIGFCVALFASLIAALAGSVAGLVGGWTDRAVMWLVDLLLSTDIVQLPVLPNDDVAAEPTPDDPSREDQRG